MFDDNRLLGGEVLRALTEQATIQIPGVTTVPAAEAVERAGFDAVLLDGPGLWADANGRPLSGTRQPSDGTASEGGAHPLGGLERLVERTRRLVSAVRLSVLVDIGPLPLDPATAKSTVAELEAVGAAAVFASLPTLFSGRSGNVTTRPSDDRLARALGLSATQQSAWLRAVLEAFVAGRRSEGTILAVTCDATAIVPPPGLESAAAQAERSDRLDQLAELAEEARAVGLDWFSVVGVSDEATLTRLASRIVLPLVMTYRRGAAIPPDLATLAGMGFTAAVHADLLARVEDHVRKTALSVLARDGGPQELSDLLHAES